MKKQLKNKKRKATIPVSNNITGCQFYGVKGDAPSLDVMKIVATGLTNLTELFESQHIEINALLRVDSEINKPD